ncbi:MAG: hypothetical protein PHG73_04490, partial [Pygmaiobacter sp.]|nr:hypothetical protein [Pygmaiobacter sp.]
ICKVKSAAVGKMTKIKLFLRISQTKKSLFVGITRNRPLEGSKTLCKSHVTYVLYSGGIKPVYFCKLDKNNSYLHKNSDFESFHPHPALGKGACFVPQNRRLSLNALLYYLEVMNL